MCTFIQLVHCFIETDKATCSNCISEDNIPCNPREGEWYCCARDEIDQDSKFCNQCYENPKHGKASYKIYSPCFSTNINCLTETSYIKLDSENEKTMSSTKYYLKKGEICHFKFVLPPDTLDYMIANHRWNMKAEGPFIKEYEYTNLKHIINFLYFPIKMDGTYKLGGGDINEVILTVVATENNPIIEFTYKEGWVTLLSRPMFYALITITGITVIGSVIGFVYYVVKYVKPWVSVINTINSILGRPIIQIEDEESEFQTQPISYKTKDIKGNVVYERANMQTESFDTE